MIMFWFYTRKKILSFIIFLFEFFIFSLRKKQILEDIQKSERIPQLSKRIFCYKKLEDEIPPPEEVI